MAPQKRKLRPRWRDTIDKLMATSKGSSAALQNAIAEATQGLTGERARIDGLKTEIERMRSERAGLLLDGTADDVLKLDGGVHSATVAVEMAEAAIPGRIDALNELKEHERKAALVELLAAVEAAAPKYLEAALALPAAALEYTRALEALRVRFGAETMAIPTVCPLALDLGAMNGARGTVRAPTQIFDFSLRLSESLAAIRRKAQ